MKKLFLLLAAPAILSSCSLVDDDDPDSFLRVFVPVVSADLPESFVVGQEYNIRVTYSPPTRCHEFQTIDYESEGNEFFIGIVNSYSPNDPSCDEIEGLTNETSFSFTPETNDFYIFNFWQGQNERGEAEFLTIEVPVDPVDSENEV